MAARGEAHQLQRGINDVSDKAEDLTQYLTRMARAIADADSQLFLGYTKLIRDLAIEVVDTVAPGGENREKRFQRRRAEGRTEEEHEVARVVNAVSDALDVLTELGRGIDRAISASVDVEKRSLEHFERTMDKVPAHAAAAKKSPSRRSKASVTTARRRASKKRPPTRRRAAAA
jgi:hypothetical protein